MPKLRQPITLEELALGSLERYILGVMRCAVGDAASGITPREISVSGLSKFLHADLPCTLSRKLTYQIFKLPNKCKILDEHENRVQKVITDVISASLSPDLEILNMTALPTYTCKTVTEYMHKFKKLHTLLSYNPHGLENTRLFLSGLSSLKCLVKFQMKYSCTDDLIIILGLNNYETIEQIDVTDSKDVTDESFKSLMKCHKLRALLISGTSMEAKGYIEFLQYKISNVTAERLQNLGVGRLSEQGFSSRELDETAATCSMLRELVIVKLRGDIGKLCNLTKLEKVEIRNIDSVECNLDTFLRVRGSNLISLDLSQVTSLDFMCIVNHCVNLKELIMYSCSITDMGKTPSAKTFLNLKEIMLMGHYPLNLVEYILSACIDIRRFRLWLYSQEYITDEFILRILLLCNFRKLQYLDLVSMHNTLSIKSLNAIIEQCPLLEKMWSVCYWRGITSEQRKELRRKIEFNNQNLWLDFRDD